MTPFQKLEALNLLPTSHSCPSANSLHTEGAAVISEMLQWIIRWGAFPLQMLKTNPQEEWQQFPWLHESLILLTQNAKWIWRLEENVFALKGKALKLDVVHIVIIYNCWDLGTAEAIGTHRDTLKIIAMHRALNTNTHIQVSQVHTTYVYQRNASLSPPLWNKQNLSPANSLPKSHIGPVSLQFHVPSQS